MQFHPFARRLLALALTAAFMTTAALSGFAVYAMPIQAAYPQESIYLFDADNLSSVIVPPQKRLRFNRTYQLLRLSFTKSDIARPARVGS